MKEEEPPMSFLFVILYVFISTARIIYEVVWWFFEDLSLEDYLTGFFHGISILGTCAVICFMVFLCLGCLKIKVDRRLEELQIDGLKKFKIDCVISLGGMAIGGIIPKILMFFEPPGFYMKYYGLVICPFSSILLICLFSNDLGVRYKIDSKNHTKLKPVLYFLHVFFGIYTFVLIEFIYKDRKTQELVNNYQLWFSALVAFSTVELTLVLAGGIRDSLAPNVPIQKTITKPAPRSQQTVENDPRIECKICLLEYNDNTRTPRILKECGHTVCQECAQNFLNKFNNIHLFCPFCQQISVVKGPATLLAKNLLVTDFMSKFKNDNN